MEELRCVMARCMPHFAAKRSHGPEGTPCGFAHPDCVPVSETDSTCGGGTGSRPGVVSPGAGELLSCRPIVLSSFEGIGLGLREGLKRCLRGMGHSSVLVVTEQAGSHAPGT